MKPYFESVERVARLKAVAGSWVGTPFAAHACVRGAGVDCIHFVAEVLRECGQLPGYEFPAYRLDGGEHLQESQVTGWLRAHPLFIEVDVKDPRMPGDVLEFRIGAGVSHHVGLMGDVITQRIWSSLGGSGLQVRVLRDGTWGRRLVRAWRPMDKTE